MDERQIAEVVGKVAVAVAKDVYADVAQPTAQELGKRAGQLTKLALSPIALANYGYEQCKAWLEARVQQRLSNIPEDQRIEPSLSISYPLLTSIATHNDKENLRELYLELLLKAMDKRTASLVHPSYVNIVGQLAPEEALILIAIAEHKPELSLATHVRLNAGRIVDVFQTFCLDEVKLEDVSNASVWLDSLLRLRLLTIDTLTQNLRTRPDHIGWQGGSIVEGDVIQVLMMTDFGRQFVEACRPSGEERHQAVV